MSNQLKTVARLISGGLESKVYLVKLNGFDTHFGQVQSQNDITGDHNDLLTELDQAVSKFMLDISSQGFQDDIVGLTFSEFGRKAKENGNLGTDHGEIAPMFVFGTAINGGVSGTNPDLTVHRGKKQEYCAGSIAQIFESIGGSVVYFGKPYPLVYNLSADIKDKRVLCIGDNLNTDIKGANLQNFKSLFILNGIHSNCLLYTSDAADE